MLLWPRNRPQAHHYRTHTQILRTRTRTPVRHQTRTRITDARVLFRAPIYRAHKSKSPRYSKPHLFSSNNGQMRTRHDRTLAVGPDRPSSLLLLSSIDRLVERRLMPMDRRCLLIRDPYRVLRARLDKGRGRDSGRQLEERDEGIRSPMEDQQHHRSLGHRKHRGPLLLLDLDHRNSRHNSKGVGVKLDRLRSLRWDSTVRLLRRRIVSSCK